MSRRPFAALAALCVAVWACDAPGGPGRFLSIGTGGTGGVYYPLGGALASRLSLRDSTRQYTAEVTGGSVENVNRIREGQIDLGFALAITAYEAYHGGVDYDAAVSDLRVVAPLYPNVVHVLVPQNSDLRGLSDLRGRRVSVGSAGSGTEQVSRQLLAAAGLTYDDVDAVFLSFSESAAALRDGAIAAAILSVGFPAAAVLEATTSTGAGLLPIGEDVVRVLRERHPYYSPGVIPADVYPGLVQPVPTVSMMNLLVASVSLADEVVTDVLNILDEERVSLTDVHEMAGRIDLAAHEDLAVPLHPAARRWYDAR